jgi:hypothetical protein
MERFFYGNQNFLIVRQKIPTMKCYFIAVKNSKVFAICTPVHLITIYNSGNGKIISQYAIDKGIAAAIECSPYFLFILYVDWNVHYTLDFHHVFTYSVDNMKTPKYNTLRVDDKYMFYVLCKNNDDYFIYQWSVYSDINVANVVSFKMKNDRISSSGIKISKEMVIRRKIIKILNYKEKIQNSFFTPVTCKDDIGGFNLVFFSGGSILGKGICRDIFVHHMILDKEFNLETLPSYKISVE